MKTKVALAIVVVLVVLGGLAGVKALQIKKMMDSGKSFAPPPEASNARGTLPAPVVSRLRRNVLRVASCCLLSP